jgi:hypothetical protein
MVIDRISGGIEYRPEVMTLVFPGDREYRVRTNKVNSNLPVSTPQTVRSSVSTGGAGISMMNFTSKGSSFDSQNAIAYLRHLGDMEAEGVQSNYSIMDIRDEYVGMKGRVIDIWV